MQFSIHSKEYQALRDWLIAQRQDHTELTQRDLAARLGVHRSVIAKIECGDRKMDVFDYIEYCQALGADPHQGIAAMMKLLSPKKKSR
jgi:transcriptional regulator with XRE-family HTH domain